MTTISRIDVHPFTDKGHRDYQEDFFYTDPPDGRPWLGVVADGMGGHEGGDIASKAGVMALKRGFDASRGRRGDLADALSAAVTQGHEAVLDAAQKAGAVGNMGSTIVAFVIDRGVLRWCSAGDSRIYHVRDGILVQLSRDFTIEEDMKQGVARGEWSQEELENSPQRKALTSFMGTDHWRHHDGSEELRNGDIVVACSDGVYGTIQAAGITASCAFADGAGTAQQIAQDMLKRILDAGKPNQDNSTAIVVRYFAEKDEAVPAAPSRSGGGLLRLGAIVAVLAALGVGGFFALKPYLTAGPVATVAGKATPLPSKVPPPGTPVADKTAPAAPPAPRSATAVDQADTELAGLRAKIADRSYTPVEAAGIARYLRDQSGAASGSTAYERYTAFIEHPGPVTDDGAAHVDHRPPAVSIPATSPADKRAADPAKAEKAVAEKATAERVAQDKSNARAAEVKAAKDRAAKLAEEQAAKARAATEKAAKEKAARQKAATDKFGTQTTKLPQPSTTDNAARKAQSGRDADKGQKGDGAGVPPTSDKTPPDHAPADAERAAEKAAADKAAADKAAADKAAADKAKTVDKPTNVIQQPGASAHDVLRPAGQVANGGRATSHPDVAVEERSATTAAPAVRVVDDAAKTGRMTVAAGDR